MTFTFFRDTSGNGDKRAYIIKKYKTLQKWHFYVFRCWRLQRAPLWQKQQFHLQQCHFVWGKGTSLSQLFGIQHKCSSDKARTRAHSSVNTHTRFFKCLNAVGMTKVNFLFCSRHSAALQHSVKEKKKKCKKDAARMGRKIHSMLPLFNSVEIRFCIVTFGVYMAQDKT